MIFNGVSHLINNKARDGGAILAIGSKMYFNGKITFAYNEATSSNGGGISMDRSNLEIKGECDISHNFALNGGGIFKDSFTIQYRILKLSGI